jgi:serine protease Do
MKNWKNSWLVGLFALGAVACSTDFEDIPHYVVQVEDGNTLVLKSGIKVHLIGVEPTSASQEFLEDKALHNKIRVVFDRSNYPNTSEAEEVWGYATVDGVHLNAQILQHGLASLNDTWLTDSLRAFSSYSTLTAHRPVAAMPEGGPVKKEFKPITTTSARTEFSNFADLVEYAEQCVFLVLGRDEKGKTVSQGTGFFLQENGLCVSNYHVFEGGVEWMIRTANGSRYKVTDIIAKDKNYDYIIFKVDLAAGEEYPFLKPAPRTPRKGTDIFVLGNPRGLESTITRGIVSAVRDQGMKEAVIQIDAAISPGSSGSPVMTMDGEVIGIATYKARDCESCNFAMNVQVLGF